MAMPRNRRASVRGRVRKTTTRMGTRKMRRTVRAFGRFSVAVLGSFRS
jgi:hypothetical protein